MTTETPGPSAETEAQLPTATSAGPPTWWPVVALLTAAIGLLLVMSEIQRLIGELVDGGGDTTTVDLSAFHSPDVIAQTLSVWQQGILAEGGSPVVGWLILQLVADLLFIAAYTAAGLVLSQRLGLGLRRSVLFIAITDLLEDLVAGFTYLTLAHPLLDLRTEASVMALTTGLKWFAVALLLLRAVLQLRANWSTGEAPRRRTLLRWTVKKHRFGLLVVVLLAVLLLVPLAGVTDQAPDVIRGWLDPGRWPGALGAVIVFVLLAFSLRYLAALRTASVVREVDSAGSPWRRDRWWVWLVVVAAVGGVVWLLALFGLAQVQPAPFLIAGAVIALVGGLSGLITWLQEFTDSAPRNDDPLLVDWVRATGGALSLAPLSILALCAVRALLPLAVLQRGWSIALLLLALLIACGIWAIPRFVSRLGLTAVFARWEARATVRPLGATSVADPGRLTRTPEVVLLLAVLVVNGALIVFPLQLAGWIGMLAVLALGFVGFTLFLSFIAMVVQRRTAARLFHPWFRTTPAVTVIVVAGVLASTIGASSAHDVRTIPGAQTTRPAYSAATETWLDTDPGSCALPTTIAGRDVDIRPMLFVATAGGGIRAAYWTADVLASAAASPCYRNAIFATSGVSGGSVGLAVLSAVGAKRAVQGVKDLADPNALGAATAGLLARDTLAGSIGVSFWAAGAPVGSTPLTSAVRTRTIGSTPAAAPATAFPDRAALLEEAWSSDVSALGEPFPMAAAASGEPGAARLPWLTFFNSSSVLSGCRAIVGSVELDERKATSPPGCSGSTTTGANDALPGAYDLLKAEPCLQGRLSVATAALLSARFTYISPSALIRGCSGHAIVDQLIDGGYIENTGLATANLLVQRALPLIRAHNAQQLTRAVPQLVVPMVMSIDNSPQPWHAKPPKDQAANEVLLPLEAKSRGASTLTDRDALLAQVQDSADDWLPCTDCAVGAGSTTTKAADVRNAVGEALGSNVFTVAPLGDPDVSAPLGWALSDASEQALDRSLACYTGAAGGDCVKAPAITRAATYRTLGTRFAQADG